MTWGYGITINVVLESIKIIVHCNQCNSVNENITNGIQLFDLRLCMCSLTFMKFEIWSGDIRHNFHTGSNGDGVVQSAIFGEQCKMVRYHVYSQNHKQQMQLHNTGSSRQLTYVSYGCVRVRCSYLMKKTVPKIIFTLHWAGS